MSPELNPGRWALSGLGVAVGGVVGGLALDRVMERVRLRPEEPDAVELGSLRGDVHEVKTDDGLKLYAEVDEVAPYGSQANHDHRATIVFVHGFALNMDCWHFQRLAFRGKRRMIFYDQRSHGRSERSEKEHATIDQLGRDLRSVLDTLAPGEPVVLVGHSMGGMSIVAYAEHYPELFAERVVGLGLISTTAGGQRTHKIVSRHIPDPVGRRAVERGLLVAAERERVLELARRSGSGIAFRVIREFAFGDAKVPASYVRFVDTMIASTPMAVLVEFIPEFDALDKFHVVDAFSELPIYIVCGTKDKLTSIGHARKLHSRIEGSHLLELPGGGHMPLLEFKDRVNDVLHNLFEDSDDNLAARR